MNRFGFAEPSAARDTNGKTVASDEPGSGRDGSRDSKMKSRLLNALRRITEKQRDAHIERLRVSRNELFEKLREIPNRMQKLTNQMRLLLDLVDDYWDGRYRGVRWHSLAFAVLAVLYFLSPSDIVPDWLPIAGRLDDLAAVAIALRFLKGDLEKYCEFRGLDPGEYF